MVDAMGHEIQNVDLSKRALQDVLIAGGEAYPYEAVGILFGRRFKRRIFVERVYAYQISDERSRYNVKPNRDAVRQVKAVCTDLTGFGEIIGGFHSHTYYKSETFISRLSTSDWKAVDRGNVELLVSVVNDDPTEPGHLPSKATEYRCAADGFVFSITAWYRGRIAPYVGEVTDPAALTAPRGIFKEEKGVFACLYQKFVNQ